MITSNIVKHSFFRVNEILKKYYLGNRTPIFAILDERENVCGPERIAFMLDDDMEELGQVSLACDPYQSLSMPTSYIAEKVTMRKTFYYDATEPPFKKVHIIETHILQELEYNEELREFIKTSAVIPKVLIAKSLDHFSSRDIIHVTFEIYITGADLTFHLLKKEKH